MNVMLVEADKQRVRLLCSALRAVRYASIDVVNVATCLMLCDCLVSANSRLYF